MDRDRSLSTLGALILTAVLSVGLFWVPVYLLLR